MPPTDGALLVELDRDPPVYALGETLTATFMDFRFAEGPLEVSVSWYTEGKGTEDRRVVYFDARRGVDVGGTLSVRLPHAPVSYNGTLLKIHWCVRLRRNQQLTEKRFEVGQVDWPSCKLESHAGSE